MLLTFCTKLYYRLYHTLATWIVIAFLSLALTDYANKTAKPFLWSLGMALFLITIYAIAEYVENYNKQRRDSRK